MQSSELVTLLFCAVPTSVSMKHQKSTELSVLLICNKLMFVLLF